MYIEKEDVEKYRHMTNKLVYALSRGLFFSSTIYKSEKEYRSVICLEGAVILYLHLHSPHSRICSLQFQKAKIV